MERVFTLLSEMESFHYNLLWSGILIQTNRLLELKYWLNKTIDQVTELYSDVHWELWDCVEKFDPFQVIFIHSVEITTDRPNQCVETSQR